MPRDLTMDQSPPAAAASRATLLFVSTISAQTKVYPYQEANPCGLQGYDIWIASAAAHGVRLMFGAVFN